MTKREKLLQKALKAPKDFRFQDLESLLRQFGFRKIKTNAGSHFKWRHTEKMITYMAPKKNPVKQIYIKNLLKLLKVHFNLSSDGQ